MGARFTAGQLDCDLLVDGEGRLPASFAFATADVGELDRALAGRQEITAPYQCLFVRTADAVVLVDTGLGAYEHPLGGTGGRLDDALRERGVAPGEIDVVVISHGHIDHIGGLSDGGQPRFARARHVVSRVEWEHRTSGSGATTTAREQLPPLEASGLVELVDAPAEVAAGIRLLPAPGHTPGHLVVELGGRALFLADAIAHELHAQHPSWVMEADDDPDLNVETRRSLLGRAADEGLVVAAAHIAEPAHVERHGDGFLLRPL